jgi:ArsR family transcriptional regulator, lead/cadmium/zinc/bismuth-responsive transcriptional repressor
MAAISSPRTSAKQAAGDRELIGGDEAGELVGLFKMLANDTRLRMLHALARAGELCVSELAAELELSPQAVSNQLQRLTDRRVLAARRDGSRIFYGIADPCVVGLLDLGLCLLEETGRGSGS